MRNTPLYHEQGLIVKAYLATIEGLMDSLRVQRCEPAIHIRHYSIHSSDLRQLKDRDYDPYLIGCHYKVYILSFH